jgi:hypothetical protein
MPWYIHTPTQIIWLVTLLLVAGYTLWKGGRPERVAAVASLLASFATPLMPNTPGQADPELGALILDSALLAVLLGVSLLTDRVWALFAAAFQLLLVAIHIAIMADPRVGSWAFMTALLIFSYLVIFAMGVGARLHTLDQRQQFPYPRRVRP